MSLYNYRERTATYVCIDVGGTELKAAALNGAGELITTLQYFISRAGEEKSAVIAHFAGVIETIFKASGQTQLSGVRMAFPGPFDYENGICLLKGLDKYDSLYGVSLREEIKAALLTKGLILGELFDIRFVNDVGGFALGETSAGDAQGAKRAMFVCIGTGCGSAFCENGSLAKEGTKGVPPSGYIYNTPFKESIIDDYLSKRGLAAIAAEAFGGAVISGLELANLAKGGDKKATECFVRFGENIKAAILPFAEGFHPDCIVMGGQVIKSAELFITPLQASLLAMGIKLCFTEDTSKRTLQGLITL